MKNNIEQIMRYLANEMEQEERVVFENRLKSDNDFAEDFSTYQEMEKLMNGHFQYETEENKLLATLQSTTTDFFNKNQEKNSGKVVKMKSSKKISETQAQKPTTNIRKIVFGITAAAAILLFFMFIPQFFNSSTSYEQYANHPTASSMVRGTNDNTNLAEADVFFNKENYKKAIPIYQKAYNENPSRLDILLNLGICQLETNKTESAIQSFEKLTEKETAYTDWGYWYLALTYLKKQNKTKTLEYLNQISDDFDWNKKVEALKAELR